MSSEIINKIEKAGLVIVDVSDFEPKSQLNNIDLANWLDDNMIIKEASFRKKLEGFNWRPYLNNYVSVTCSKDVIIPPWTYSLIQVKLLNIAKQVFFTNVETMRLLVVQKNIHEHDFNKYKNKKVFLKICNNKKLSMGTLSLCVNAFSQNVKSLSFGEPCSNIPLIKNQKK